MRALHRFGEYLPLTESWAFNLLKHLPETDVLIAANRFTAGATGRALDRVASHAPHFRYLELPFPRPAPSTVNRWLAPLDRATGELYRVVWPPYLRALAGRVDVLHSHFANQGYLDLPVARWLRVPHVVSFYGVDYKKMAFEAPRWWGRFPKLFRAADLFLAEGRYGARTLVELGCPPAKVAVQRLGVETERIAVHARSKRPGELRLLQVASFQAKKGHEDTLAAFEAALGDCPNLTLTFVGGTNAPLRRTLEARVDGGPARGRVTFSGPIPFAELHAFMADFHVFIHPSRHTPNRDCEGGAPVVLLDAQATGMPVIATRHCDIPAEVADGTSGLLASEREIPALADAIRRFYAMAQREFDTFAVSARRHVEARYDIRRNAEALRTKYDALVAAWPASGAR